MALFLRNKEQAKKAKTFKSYCSFVKECAEMHGKGIFVEIDPIAKYEGDYTMEYKYSFFKYDNEGQKIYIPVIPPVFVTNYNKEENHLDNRIQMDESEWMEFLDEIENKYYN